MKTKKLQPDYTTNGNVYQLVIPMDIGEMIPADDSVRLLNAVMEKVDYRRLYGAYSRTGRIEMSPKRLFKVLIYGYMNGMLYSESRAGTGKDGIQRMFLQRK